MFIRIACLVVTFVLATALPGWSQSDEVKKHLADLNSKGDWFIRADGAAALGKMKEKAVAAVPALVRRLDDSDMGVRKEVAKALGEIGKSTPAMVRKLRKLLRNEKAAPVRVQAAYALSQIDPPPKGALDELIETFRRDRDLHARMWAARALGHLGETSKKAVPHLFASLSHESRTVRRAAAYQFARISDDCLDLLIKKGLTHRHPHVISWSLRALEKYGPRGGKALTPVSRLLKHEKWYIRRHAAWALGEICPKSPAVILPLIRTLSDGHHTVRKAAARSLARAGAGHPLSKGAVTMSMERKHLPTRYHTIMATAKIPHNIETTKHIIKYNLRHPEAIIRRATAYTLYHLKPPVRGLIFSLKNNMDDKNKDVRHWTARALAVQVPQFTDLVLWFLQGLAGSDVHLKMGCAEALFYVEKKAPSWAGPLIAASRHQNHEVRHQAFRALTSLKLNTKPVWKAYLRALGDNEYHVRKVVTDRILEMGPTHYRKIAPLVRSKNVHHRFWSAYILERWTKEAVSSIDDLVANLDDVNKNVRDRTARALGAIGPKATPPLVKALASSDSLNRLYAARALRYMGPPAKAALSDLVKATGHPDINTKKAVVEAIGYIGPDAGSAIPALFQMFFLKNRPLSIAAGVAVKRIGPAMRSHCLKYFRHSDPYLRYWALQCLGNLGPRVASTTPEVVKLLSDPDGKTRSNAAWVLGKFGLRSLPHMKKVARLLADTGEKCRYEAAEALGRMDHRVIPLIRPYLRHKDPKVQAWAVNAIGQLKGQGWDGAPDLARLIDDSYHKQVQEGAILTLSRMGPAGAREVDKILAALAGRHQPVVLAAGEGLYRLLPHCEHNVQAFRNGLRHSHPFVRAFSARAIGEIEPLPTETLQELNRCLRDEKYMVRAAAAWSMKAIQRYRKGKKK